jgi:F0F1-type ATP synthase assembly protein I
MAPQEPVGRELGTGYKYVSLGISFAGGIVLFMGLGFLLDRWLHLSPLFTITGTLAGAVLSFMWVFAKLRQDEKEYDAEHPRKPRRDQ